MPIKLKDKEFEDLVEELKELAKMLGATVRFEKGDFRGGYCLVKESSIIVINKLANTQRKAVILATALKELGIDNIYVNPRTREIISELVDTPEL